MTMFLKKLSAALRFRNVAWSVGKIQALERLTVFMARRLGRLQPLTTPQAVVIRCTERCFLRCQMCGQNGPQGRLRDQPAKDRQRVNPIVYDRMCNEIEQWRLKPLVKFTGGEPLLEWKTLKPVIERLSAAGCVVKLNTNGVLLKNPRVAEEMVTSGVHYLSVSVDGDEETHSLVRGVKKAFSAARQGVLNVADARTRLGSTYPMLLVSYVVSTLNEHSVTKLSDLASDWRIDWLNIQFLNYLTPQRSEEAHRIVSERLGIDDQPWKGFEIPELTMVNARALARGIESIKQDAPCPVSSMNIGTMGEKTIHDYYYTDAVLKDDICHMPFVTMFVVPPGTAVFCIDYPFYYYGNLQTESMSDVWLGEDARRFRKELLGHYQAAGSNFPQCLRCNWPYNT